MPVCQHCTPPKAFSLEQAFLDHIKDKHIAPRLICRQCTPPRQFSLSQAYQDHVKFKVHPNNGPILLCGWSGCLASFKSHSLRDAHMASHRTVGQALPSSSRRQSSLPTPARQPPPRNHSLPHHQGNPPPLHIPASPFQMIYSCGVPHCGAQFTIQADLQRHGAHIHPSPPSTAPLPSAQPTGTRLTCPQALCGGVFLTPMALGQHVMGKHQSDVHASPLTSQAHFVPKSLPNPSQAPEQQIGDLCSYFERMSRSPSSSSSRSSLTASTLASTQYSISPTETPPSPLSAIEMCNNLPWPRDSKADLLILPGAKVYQHTLSLLVSHVNSRHFDNKQFGAFQKLDQCINKMHVLGIVSSLVDSEAIRRQLMEVAESIGLKDTPDFRKKLEDDEYNMVHMIRSVLNTKRLEEDALELREGQAKLFLDLLRNTSKDAHDTPFRSQICRLVRKMCQACGFLPTSLFLEGVHSVDKDQAMSGGFADVFKATTADGKPVALKRFRRTQANLNDTHIESMLYREVLVWETFKHPYLLPFMGVEYGAFPAHPPCIVTPWMKNGTIMNYIDRSNSSMQNTHRLSLEIAQGLDYLHASNVLHGDLRGCNILIDDECHVRLADFGLSTFINGYMSTQSSKEHGSKRWMAPELHDPDIEFRRTAKSDIYSLACVFLEVHTRKHPFAEISVGKDLSVPSKVLGGQRPQRPSAEILPDSVWDIIQAAWTHIPTERPTACEILRMMKMIDMSLPVV